MTPSFAACRAIPSGGGGDHSSLFDTSRISRLMDAGWCRLDAGSSVFLSSDPAGLWSGDGILACGSARLHDAQDLRLKLRDDTPPDDGSDLALLARLQSTLGNLALVELKGAFSAVIWNERQKQMTIVRDHLGMMPLYEIQRDHAAVFANDMRVTMHLSGKEVILADEVVASFIEGREPSGQSTVFKGVSRFPPGHVLDLDIAGRAAQPEQYWALELPAEVDKVEAPALLRGALEAAVGAAMRSDPSAAFMLSGGLDSSTLTVVGAEHRHPVPVRTISMVYPEAAPYNESLFIDEVRAATNAEAIDVLIDEAPDLHALHDVVEEQFDLCPAPGMLKSRRIYFEAHQNGVKTLVDGHGGDEVVSHGFTRLVELAAARRYFTLLTEMRGASRIFGQPWLGSFFVHLHNYAGWSRRDLRRRIAGRLGRHFQGRSHSALAAGDLLSPALKNALEAVDSTHEARAEVALTERLDHLNAMTSPLLSRGFEVLYRTAAAQGIHPEYPFFDRGVIETCLAVPSEAKLHSGYTRFVLREAMSGLLPERVRWRTDKMDFTGEVVDALIAYLANPENQRRTERLLDGYVDIEAFRKTLIKVRVDALGRNRMAVQVLWRCIYLAFFLEHFGTWKKLQREGRLC